MQKWEHECWTILIEKREKKKIAIIIIIVNKIHYGWYVNLIRIKKWVKYISKQVFVLLEPYVIQSDCTIEKKYIIIISVLNYTFSVINWPNKNKCIKYFAVNLSDFFFIILKPMAPP